MVLGCGRQGSRQTGRLKRSVYPHAVVLNTAHHATRLHDDFRVVLEQTNKARLAHLGHRQNHLLVHRHPEALCVGGGARTSLLCSERGSEESESDFYARRRTRDSSPLAPPRGPHTETRTYQVSVSGTNPKQSAKSAPLTSCCHSPIQKVGHLIYWRDALPLRGARCSTGRER